MRLLWHIANPVSSQSRRWAAETLAYLDKPVQQKTRVAPPRGSSSGIMDRVNLAGTGGRLAIVAWIVITLGVIVGTSHRSNLGLRSRLILSTTGTRQTPFTQGGWKRWQIWAITLLTPETHEGALRRAQPTSWKAVAQALQALDLLWWWVPFSVSEE